MDTTSSVVTYLLLVLVTMTMANDIYPVITTENSQIVTFSYPRLVNQHVVFTAVDQQDDESFLSIDIETMELNTLMKTASRSIPETSSTFTGAHMGHGGVVYGGKPALVFIGSDQVQSGIGIFRLVRDRIHRVVQIGDVIPGRSNSSFERFQYAGISSDLDVVFYGISEQGKWAGIYLSEPENNIEKIVDFNTKVPGLDVTFDFLSNPVVGKKKIVFFGSRQAVTEIPGSRAQPGLYCYDMKTGRISVIVDFSMKLPNDQETFTAFSEPDFDGRYAAFIGKGTGGSMGIFQWSALTGNLKSVALTNGKEDIVHFPQVPAVWKESMAFVGVSKQGKTGVYTWKDNETRKIMAVGDEYRNQKVEYVGAAAGAINDDFVAFYSVLRNETSVTAGIYISRI